MPAPIHAAQAASGHRPEHEGGISITTLTASPKTPTQFGGLTLRPETLRAIHQQAWTGPPSAGQPIERQFTALRRRPHIAVATPGRLLDHLQRRTVSLEAVTVVILDEADRMLDMGFLPDVSRILKQTPAARQTALFSATMPPAIRALAEQWLRRPVRGRIDAPRPTGETVEQYYLEVMEEDKVRALRRLLVKETIPSALVFRRTKHRVDRLARALGRDRTVGVLHGGVRQEARLQALRASSGWLRWDFSCIPGSATTWFITTMSTKINFDMPE